MLWPIAQFRAKARHADNRSSHRSRKPLPGLRRVLFLFIELAAVHYRGRRRARSDSARIRQRETVGHALRRRPLLGIVGQDRGCDVLRNLCGSTRSLPDLHARRRRMPDGAAETWAAGVGLILAVVPAKAGTHTA